MIQPCHGSAFVNLSVMRKLKRKAQSASTLVVPSPTKKKMTFQPPPSEISPSSKILIFKLDVNSCNGQPIDQHTELGAADLENIWTQTFGRSLEELSGYTSSKRNKEIRIQFQLKNPLSIKDIANEQEFTYERSSVFATDLFRCRVVGLGDVRLATIGETVKLTINTPNFDITPDQILEWISKFGKVKEGHRYLDITLLSTSRTCDNKS